MDFLITILEQGLIYGILGLGVYITYKILDFPDLTADGSNTWRIFQQLYAGR